MKPALISAIVAAIVSVVALSFEDVFERDDEGGASSEVAPARAAPAPVPGGVSLSYTDELPEDVWVNGARQAGSDRRSLADAAHSVCYVTKLEIKGIQGPEDSNSCVIGIDEFLGFWELVVTVEEGSQSEVRCNARCLVWE